VSLRSMNWRTVPLAVTVLALGVLTACNSGGNPPPPDQGASAEIKVMMPQELSADDVTRVRVEVQGPGIPTPIGMDLTRQGSTWQGTLTDIPAGLDRVFEAKAFDASATLLYQGQAGPMTIPSGSTVSVAILLQEVNPQPPFQNVAPVIDSVVVSANQVSPGGTITLTASAHDDNPGDTITYAWTATAGTFSAPSSATTSWVAPATEGAQTLRLEVTDSKNASARLSIDISVQRPGATGSAAVTVTFNTWPSVSAMMATPSVLTLNVPSQIAAVVSDPDGDTLSFTWSSDCPGFFDQGWTPTPSFTLFNPPFQGNQCTLTVQASDGRGGQHSGSLTLLVGPVPRANVAPQVDSTFKSSEQAGSNEVVTMGLTAHDQEGTALTFTWTTNQGTILVTRGTTTSTEVDWRAPACLEGAAILTAAITDAGGATTRQQFSITPRGGSTCGGTAVVGVRNSHRVRADGNVTLIPIDLSSVTLGAWVPTTDGLGYNWRPGSGQASGTFLIPNVESTPYLLQLGSSYVWATSRNIDLSRADLGRPDAQLEPEGTQLSVQLHGLVPWQDTDDLQLHSANAGIGYFSGASCAFPSWTPPFPGDQSYFSTLDYVFSLQNCGALAARIDGTRGDVLYVTQLASRSEAGGLSFQELRRSYQTTSLSSGGGNTLTLSGFMSPVSTTTRTVNYPASSFEALALAAHPTAALTTTSLNIGTLPGYTQFGSFAGWPDLALANGTAGRGDLAASFTYGNPYPGAWPQFITALSSARVRYSVRLPDGSASTPRSFSVYTYSQQPLTGSTSSLTPQVGPARDLRINGAVATGDLTGVGLTPLLSWTAPSVGTANYYSVRVYELLATGDGGTTRLPVSTLTTAQTQVRLPPGLLVAGKFYYVQVNAVSQPASDPNRPFVSGPMYHFAMAVTGRFEP
jgi:hypothetical protein